MNHRPETFKMAQLREKTDRELVQIIGSTLDEALHSMRHAAGIGRARQARAEAGQLLRFVAGAAERRSLEPKLAQLDAELEMRLDVRARAAS